MEPSRKSHAIELILFLWHYAIQRHWKLHTEFEAATINHLHAPVTTLMFGCSGTKIYDLLPVSLNMQFQNMPLSIWPTHLLNSLMLSKLDHHKYRPIKRIFTSTTINQYQIPKHAIISNVSMLNYEIFHALFLFQLNTAKPARNLR